MSNFLRIIGVKNHYFPLYPAAFTLGSSEEDDVFLSYDGVLSNHAKVIFASNILSLQSALGPVYLDGKKVSAYPQEIAANQVLSIGQNVHLFYGEHEADEPPPPAFAQEEQAPPAPAPWLSKKTLVAIVMAVLIIGANIGLIATLLTTYSTHSAPAKVADIPKQGITREFLEEVLGEDLISATQKEGAWHVMAFTNPRWEQQAQDLTNLKTVSVTWVTLKDLVFHVKQGLTESIASKGLYLEHKRTHFALKGTALESQMNAINAAIAKVAAQYPPATITNEVRAIRVDFQIVSVSVSNRAAQATLRRGGQTIVVPEGGRVFDIGILKIISQNGLLIDTGSQNIFIPWRQS